jgi:MFS family permease
LLHLHVDAEVVALVAMLHFLAGIIQAPISGAVIDKFDAKKLMLFLVGFEIVTTLGLLLVHTKEDLFLLYMLVFFKMAAASFYFTTEMSLLPKLLVGENLQKANEIHSMIWSFSYTLGMAVSGFVVYFFGIFIAFCLDALLFCFAFYILSGIDFKIKKVVTTHNSLMVMMKESLTYLHQNATARHLMFVHAFVGLSAFDALVALMVERYYTPFVATSLALGLLHAMRAVGLVVGPMILSRWITKQTFVYVFLLQGVGVWLWAYVMEWFYLSLIASVFVGLWTTTLWSYSYTLLQKNIAKEYYGRVVAYNDMLFLVVAALTSYGVGFLVKHQWSLESITLCLGSGFILGGVYYWWIVQTQHIKS